MLKLSTQFRIIRHYCNKVGKITPNITNVDSRSENITYEDDNYKMKSDRLLNFDAASLESRGYSRAQKPYQPPEDVENIIIKICKEIGISEENCDLSNLNNKYELLNKCSTALRHTVPNSLLHKINNIDEIIMFYKTPIDKRFPLDQMKSFDLPKNMHVIYNYIRFHPETDTKFDGATAYPDSNNVVVNISARKKYPGHRYKKTPKF